MKEELLLEADLLELGKLSFELNKGGRESQNDSLKSCITSISNRMCLHPIGDLSAMCSLLTGRKMDFPDFIWEMEERYWRREFNVWAAKLTGMGNGEEDPGSLRKWNRT